MKELQEVVKGEAVMVGKEKKGGIRSMSRLTMLCTTLTPALLEPETRTRLKSHSSLDEPYFKMKMG